MSEVLNVTLREIILIALEITLLVGLGLLHRWKMRAHSYYVTHTTIKQREWLKLVGNEAFHYAEQVFSHYDGPAKLNEAIQYVLERAESQGITVNYAEIRAVIEKAWWETNRPHSIAPSSSFATPL